MVVGDPNGKYYIFHVSIKNYIGKRVQVNL